MVQTTDRNRSSPQAFEYQRFPLSSAHDGNGAVAHVAVPGDETDLGILDLRLAGLAPELADKLDNVVHAGHVSLGQQPAVRVDRQASADPDVAVLHERPAFAFAAEAQVLELTKDDVGEAIVDFGDGDVG